MAEGIVFGIGKVEILPDGEATPIEVGIIQNVSVDISTSQAELRGGGSKMPVAVVTTEKSISGSAEFAKFNGNVLRTVVGGTYDSGTDTIVIDSEDDSLEFKLTLNTEPDGTGTEVILHKVVSTSLGLSFSLNDFTKPSFDFSAMADSSGNVMTISL
jgi:hypothetical protein